MGVIWININQYINTISNISLFSNYPKDILIGLFGSAKYDIKVYAKDQIIHLQNEICCTMDIILDGQVAIRKIDENGNVFTISVFSSRDIIGANLIFSNRNIYPMTVISHSNAVVLHMYKELILQLSQNSNDFLIRLLTTISDRTLVLTDKINAISNKTIRQRIVDFLQYEYHIQKSPIIKLNISKKDLAERMGIQRSSLSREFNKMRKDGLLEYDARTITLKNIGF